MPSTTTLPMSDCVVDGASFAGVASAYPLARCAHEIMAAGGKYQIDETAAEPLGRVSRASPSCRSNFIGACLPTKFGTTRFARR
jgi:hypothetical protein